MEGHKHNLLGHDDLPHVRRRRRLVKRLLIGLVAAFGLAVIAAVAIAVPALGAVRSIYAEAQAGREALYAAKAAAERFEFGVAGTTLSQAALHFQDARAALDRLKPVRALPFFREDFEAAEALLGGGIEAATALREAVEVADDLLAVLRAHAGAPGSVPDLAGDVRPISSLTREEKRELLRKISEAPDRLGLARAALDRALAAFARIPRTPLTASLLDGVAPQVANLKALREALSTDLSLFTMMPRLLGWPEPKTYLFLLLNNTELRPGGGFIGTYGVVRLADGEIESFFTDDVYALDGPAEAFLKETPPAPLQTYLRSRSWFMRDANWSPDFAVSSMEVERFYRLEGGKKDLDGIIGVTPDVIADLLAVTGPIVIDGVTFDAGNVTDALEYQVEIAFAKEGIPLARRKDVVGKLGKELVARLLSLRLADLARLGAIAGKALEEKHLLAVFDDAALQAFADAQGWSGRFGVAPGDRLAVIDANLASLKTDSVMEKSVAYSLRPDGDSWIARAAATYRNTGRFTWKTTRYRTYTRFYAPIGSVFLKGEGMMRDDKLNDPSRAPGTIDVGEELGHAVFGGFISVEPGETRTLAVEYRVSDKVAKMIRDGSYALKVTKQLGSDASRLTLDLDFGKNVVRATPAEAPSEWGDTRYRLSTDLRVDREFEIALKN